MKLKKFLKKFNTEISYKTDITVHTTTCDFKVNF